MDPSLSLPFLPLTFHPDKGSLFPSLSLRFLLFKDCVNVNCNNQALIKFVEAEWTAHKVPKYSHREERIISFSIYQQATDVFLLQHFYREVLRS